MDKKVVITGVAGFIGSNLADRLLAEGFEVFGIDNLSHGIKDQVPAGVKFYPFDIRSRDIYPLFAGAEAVFHLAAKNCISDCEKDPAETADINVRGTVNVLEASKNAKVKKVILAESSAVYEGTDVFPTPESAPAAPISFYADSKMATHFFAQSFSQNHGLPVTSVRYFNVYGPRQDFRRTERPIMSEFIIQLLTGKKPVLYGKGLRSKDYIYIDDVNDFHLEILKNEKADGRTFNVGSGQAVTYKELLETLQDILKTNIEPEQRPSLTGGVLKTQADITSAKALGWVPKTPLREGLLKSIEYIKKEVLSKI